MYVTYLLVVIFSAELRQQWRIRVQMKKRPTKRKSFVEAMASGSESSLGGNDLDDPLLPEGDMDESALAEVT